DDEEEHESRLSEEARIQEEDADELYRDVNINQGRGLQVTQNVEDTHVTLTPQMKEAVREAVQIQTDRLQDLLQRENDEFLRNIDENMKKVLKGLVKNQVKEQVSRILPQIEESVNATLEAEVLVEAYEADKAILDTYGDSTILKRRREDDDHEGPFTGPNRGSKRQKEGGEQASASTSSEKATRGAGRSTTGSQSRQRSASESALF
nr:hypothetical protein [Tanacetum cinerariifolium]